MLLCQFICFVVSGTNQQVNCKLETENPILDAINTSLYASLEHGQLMRVISGQSVLYLFSWLFVRSCRFRSSSTWRLETFETLPKPLFVSPWLIGTLARHSAKRKYFRSFFLLFIPHHFAGFIWHYAKNVSKRHMKKSRPWTNFYFVLTWLNGVH